MERSRSATGRFTKIIRDMVIPLLKNRRSVAHGEQCADRRLAKPQAAPDGKSEIAPEQGRAEQRTAGCKVSRDCAAEIGGHQHRAEKCGARNGIERGAESEDRAEEAIKAGVGGDPELRR